MNNLDIFLIALGLAMDAFAVSIASGIILIRPKHSQALVIGGCFGLFQAGMPITGWLAGAHFAGFISGFDHWIAFGLLAGLGGKMIYESLKPEKDGIPINPLKPSVLLTLSIATSIDALAAGLGFAVLKISAWIPALVIGLTTFALCFAGVQLGRILGSKLESRVKTAGGIILLILGFKILIQHLLN